MSMFYDLLIAKAKKEKEPIYVEYLESNGDQWIDTEITGVSKEIDYNIVIDVAETQLAGYPILFGSRSSSGKTNRFYVAIDKAIKAIYVGNGNIESSKTRNAKGKNIYTKKDDVLHFNGDSVVKIDNVFDVYSIALMTGYFNNDLQATKDRRTVGKIYSAQFYNKGKLVGNFRPCLNPDTLRPALYNTVTKKYHYNKGDGEFTYQFSFTKLDYIQSSDGEQYIDTNYIPRNTQSFSVNTTVQFPMTRPFGTRQLMGFNVNTPYYWGAITNQTGNRAVYSLGNRQTTVLTGNKDKVSHLFNKENRIFKLVINGQNIEELKGASTFTEANYYLLRLNYGRYNLYYCTDIKMYDASITEGEYLINDLIPVRKNDGTICMYDYVKSEYLLNQGTGKFKGFINDYQVGESIQSTGTQYIDTGVTPTNETSIFMQVSNLEQYGNLTFSCLYSAKINEAKSNRFAYYNDSVTYCRGQIHFGKLFDYTLDTPFEKLLKDIKTVYQNKNLFYVDNVQMYSTEPQVFESLSSLVIFKDIQYNKWGTIKGNLHNTIIQNGKNQEQRNLIPVKKDGFIGMLDILSNKEYSNQGSGEFIFNE